MIEKARSTEIEEIISVINRSNREVYREIVPKEYFKEPLFTVENFSPIFKKMIFYTYKIDKEIVGVAGLEIECEDRARIHYVYILLEYQRKGIGTALVSFIEQIAKEKCIKKIRLLIAGKAYWALNFYKKLGYKFDSRIENPWGYDNFFAKELK